ncbi:hypothetical protein PLEOSDRAFT_1113016 [Pleurotus ostreatus PC15]|uniref:Uncharacterized protein n=1 Tax=Pleurotus ostreatus (strain PC15) TaxID=1137138 RepID=A0A067NY17_PLEO1|nr:hypothetical protein PLEOSDRAFT_1113016 [Pleurotus ostreatus PC15]
MQASPTDISSSLPSPSTKLCSQPLKPRPSIPVPIPHRHCAIAGCEVGEVMLRILRHDLSVRPHPTAPSHHGPVDLDYIYNAANGETAHGLLPSSTTC